jgi:hypothetical protein
LLVTLTIILLLAAILLTMGNIAKGSASGSACMANLSQIAKAALLYADDHDGYLPPVHTESSVLRLQGGEELPITGDVRAWRDAHLPYARDERVFFCPEDKNAGTPARYATTDGFRSSEFSSYRSAPIALMEWTLSGDGVPLLNTSTASTTVAYASDVILRGRGRREPNHTVHGKLISEAFLDGRVHHIKF